MQQSRLNTWLSFGSHNHSKVAQFSVGANRAGSFTRRQRISTGWGNLNDHGWGKFGDPRHATPSGLAPAAAVDQACGDVDAGDRRRAGVAHAATPRQGVAERDL